MRVGPIITGSLALVALQVVVSSPSTSRIAGLLSVPATLARALIDPNVPAIPDLSAKPSSSTASFTAPGSTGPGTYTT